MIGPVAERELEQEEPDVASEDRIDDRRGTFGRERHAVRPQQDGLHDAVTDAPIVSATRTATTTRMAWAIGEGPDVLGPERDRPRTPSDGPPTRREPVASLRRSNQPENDALPP